MAEYIEREALIDRLKRNLNACNPGTFSEMCFKDAINTVTNFPAADVAPVVRGRWKPIKRKNLWGDETDTLECSACKKSDVKGRAIVRHSDFCPNCGADMREG